MARRRHPSGGTAPPRSSGPIGDNAYYDPEGIDKFKMPPPLSFSPSLTFEMLASQRGVDDTLKDLKREGKWERQDIGLERRLSRRGSRRSGSDIRRERGYALTDLSQNLGRGQQDIGFERADLGTEFTRTLGDIAQARTRGEEDFQRAIGNLDRSYSQMAERQADSIAAAGAAGGGATAQSARKRAANQAYERVDIDTSAQRQREDLARSESEAREDFGSAESRLGVAESRLGEDYSTGRERTLEEARTGLQRNSQDLKTRLSELRRARQRGHATRKTEKQRAIREGTFAEAGLTQEAIFQAQQLHPNLYSRYGKKRNR